MESPELVRDLDPEATNLEGYLFPDTYSFARGTTEAEIVAKMVGTFREKIEGVQVPPAAGRTRTRSPCASS